MNLQIKFFSALITMSIVLFTYNADSEFIFGQLDDDRHKCNCTGVLGGSGEADCADTQNCSCQSGLVSCSCDCDDVGVISTGGPGLTHGPIELGPEENWNAVARYLIGSGNRAAQALGSQLPDLYSLGKNDPNSYLRRAESVNQEFENLPNKIKEDVYSIADYEEK